MSQAARAETFAALHRGESFLIPNPWDAGSARMLEALGFRALATTSSGFAFTLGRPDGGVTLDEVTAHVATLTAATSLPVSVDLENGGDDPAVAIRRVAAAGVNVLAVPFLSFGEIAAAGARRISVGGALTWVAARAAADAAAALGDGDLSPLAARVPLGDWFA
jgi:2-methylisocitrate lyase-like PEP mutase family enzyme